MTDNSNPNPVVMVSSTARDLPEHREKVQHACLRLGMFHPEMMEHLSATDANAVEVSLRMVEKADIYLGVFGFRYGYIPPGASISITEMEYNRAEERGIPRLIFLMDEKHPLNASDVETGGGAEKLKALKERLKTDKVVGVFKSPDELLALVIQSLWELHQPDLTTFHYISDIPAPPEAFIAHPYTLLQTHRLVGRQPELRLLTDWVAKPDSEVYKARILSLVAIGGLGKSALTWTWFNNIAPQEMNPLAGRMWWSFYESDATFENFVTRALAYVSHRSLSKVQQIPVPEREMQLLAMLDRKAYLIVLDGLERILIAYARMDAVRLDDSQVGDQKNLRKTADPRAGRFLKKLSQLRNSRILISTRLYPAELETEGADSIPASYRIDITGLTDADAIELWRAFNVSGSRDLLLPIFNTFGKHPLLIQALAREVKLYRPKPGDFEKWLKDNPRFEPTKFPRLKDAMGHVLEYALRGLEDEALRALQVIAAFRMPARYDNLAALLIGKEKVCAEQGELDKVLTELEDRGLLGWDRRANRYDLHPIVRGVAWSGLGNDARRGVYTNLHAHFEALPMINNYLEVKSIEDLTPAIELYNSMIGLGLYDDAMRFFYHILEKATLYRLSVSRQRIELLEMLFPDGLAHPPRLSNASDEAYTFNALAQGYQLGGQPGRAVPLFRRYIKLSLGHNNVMTGLCNLSYALQLAGALYESESKAHRVLLIARKQHNNLQEAVSLCWIGTTLVARGITDKSELALQRSLRTFTARFDKQGEGHLNSHLAQRSLWLGKFDDAIAFANRAWELAHIEKLEGDFIRAARVQGEAALGLSDFSAADERLHYALAQARAMNLAQEELPTLVALADLRRRQRDLKGARELLDDVWEKAERGPYPLFHADAWNVLAQVEQDDGYDVAAVKAAIVAYYLAWCDGPPFAYHWGLEKARALLKELGAEVPELPPFDETKFEAMPEVEIDPADEFGAGAEQAGNE
ncbi:MAG TPA: DUF4062 domain-containing protein [Pyrinomonadaceae bacterium]|nr:DUF4062 domain-containing protein [Pyrinomonadaceae bacterium]